MPSQAEGVRQRVRGGARSLLTSAGRGQRVVRSDEGARGHKRTIGRCRSSGQGADLCVRATCTLKLFVHCAEVRPVARCPCSSTCLLSFRTFPLRVLRTQWQSRFAQHFHTLFDAMLWTEGALADMFIARAEPQSVAFRARCIAGKTGREHVAQTRRLQNMQR